MRALVSGATGNVGRACVHLLTMQGWEVVGIARNTEGLAGVHKVDLTTTATANAFIANLEYQVSGGFDLVVMTHGTQHGVELGQWDFGQWYEDVRINNLDSAVNLTTVLISNGKLNPGALIVYCSSIHAMQPRAGRGPYTIAKAGLEALARVVAIEQAPDIRAVALRLGQLTQVMRGVVFTEAQFKAIEERTPYPWVEPMDVAKLCLALYEQKSLSGAVIDVDSAHSISIWPK